MKHNNIHQGHRQRMKEKFRLTGLEGFSQHEMLELLLFYAIPYRNTNDIAHRLLDKFKSMDRVFEAEINDLMEVDGISEHSATLIKLQNALFKVYMNNKKNVYDKDFTPDRAGEYITNLFYGTDIEMFYVISLDSKCRAIAADKMSEGTTNYSAVYSREIVKKVLETGATYAILAHNHPSGILWPSSADIEVTKELDKALGYINVKLIDHIIVSDNSYISMYNDCKLFENDEGGKK